MIRIDRLRALAGLRAAEDGASVFARLSLPEQVAIFGTLEAGLDKAGGALLRTAGSEH
jgi:hypothetical protein